MHVPSCQTTRNAKWTRAHQMKSGYKQTINLNTNSRHSIKSLQPRAAHQGKSLLAARLWQGDVHMPHKWRLGSISGCHPLPGRITEAQRVICFHRERCSAIIMCHVSPSGWLSAAQPPTLAWLNSMLFWPPTLASTQWMENKLISDLLFELE